MNGISQLPKDIIDIIAEYTLYYYKLVDWIPINYINPIDIAKNPRAIDLISDNLQLLIIKLNNFSLTDKYSFYQNLFKNENQKVLNLIKNNFLDEKNIYLLAISPYDEILNFVSDKYHINYGHFEFEQFFDNLSQNPNPKAVLILRKLINDSNQYYRLFLSEICSNLSLVSNVEAMNLLLEIMSSDNLTDKDRLKIFINSIIASKSEQGLILIVKLIPIMANNSAVVFISSLYTIIILNLLKHPNSRVINIIINILDIYCNGIIDIVDVIDEKSSAFYESKWTYDILNHYGIVNEYNYLLVNNSKGDILKVIKENLHLYDDNNYFWIYLALNPNDYAVDMILENFDVINNLDKELIYPMVRDINYPKILYTFAENPNIRAINRIRELFNNNSIIVTNEFWSSILKNPNKQALKLLIDNIGNEKYRYIFSNFDLWISPHIFELDKLKFRKLIYEM